MLNEFTADQVREDKERLARFRKVYELRLAADDMLAAHPEIALSEELAAYDEAFLALDEDDVFHYAGYAAARDSHPRFRVHVMGGVRQAPYGEYPSYEVHELVEGVYEVEPMDADYGRIPAAGEKPFRGKVRVPSILTMRAYSNGLGTVMGLHQEEAMTPSEFVVIPFWNDLIEMRAFKYMSGMTLERVS